MCIKCYISDTSAGECTVYSWAGTISEQVEEVSLKTIPALEKNLQRVGAPYIHGQAIPKRN